MAPERLVGTRSPFEESIERAARRAMTHREGKVCLKLPLHHKKQLFSPPAQDVICFYEEQVLPLLQEAEELPGEGLSKYLHRNLCTAVVLVLKREPEYNENIIVELTEEREPDLMLIKKGSGMIYTTSKFRNIRLIRRDKFQKPHWWAGEVPDTLFVYIRTIKDAEKHKNAEKDAYFARVREKIRARNERNKILWG